MRCFILFWQKDLSIRRTITADSFKSAVRIYLKELEGKGLKPEPQEEEILCESVFDEVKLLPCPEDDPTGLYAATRRENLKRKIYHRVEQILGKKPDRVIINEEGDAAPIGMAPPRLVPAVFFVRYDGWVLAAPLNFENLARRIMGDRWTLRAQAYVNEEGNILINIEQKAEAT